MMKLNGNAFVALFSVVEINTQVHNNTEVANG